MCYCEPMEINEVRKAAKNSGYKLGKLAQKINVGRSTLSRFVNGHSVLRGKALERLLEVLDNDMDALKKKAS